MDTMELEREFWSQVEHAVERHALLDTNNRRQLWDYFFKEEYDRMGERQLNRIAGWRRDQSIAELILRSKRSVAYKIFAGAGVLFLIALWASVAFIFGLVVVVALVGGGVLVSAENKFKARMAELNRKIAEEEKVFDALRKMIPPAPTDREVDGWLDRDTEALQAVSMQRIGLEHEDILSRDGALLIREAGSIQSDRQNGKRLVSPRNLAAYRAGSDGKVRFGVYYVQLIFLTDHKMGIYGCFYDFIAGEQKGHRTDEYFYKDVVNVNTSSSEEVIDWLTGDRVVERPGSD